jgi:hypothetical protein
LIGINSTNIAREFSNTSCTVSAKVGFRTVGVEKAHFEIGAVGILNKYDTFAAYPDTARCDLSDYAYWKSFGAVIDHHEVVAGSVHLGEMDVG